jgi:hypothetical protein
MRLIPQERTMDRTLILHIGHSKTGTTTLQKLVFPQLTGFVFFCKDRTPASAQIESAFMCSPEIWRACGDSIFNQLCAEMRQKEAAGSALISAEGISAHKIFATLPGAPNNHRRDPFLLAAHLREFQAVAQRAGFDRMKVLMGIRRQDQYLASRYVTNGWLAARLPLQSDFERQTLEIIDPDKRYFIDGVWLDYKTTHDLIAGVAGENNLLVLPVEQLGNEPSRYFSALSAFLGEPLNSLDLERKNVRSIAPDVWQIEAAEIKKAARKKRFGSIRVLLARGAEIRLAPELKEKILKVYRDSNQSLASALNLDLARYGYCGTPPTEGKWTGS